MIDRSKVMRYMNEAASPFGPLQTLPSNSETKIRIFEYADAEGDIVLGTHLALHFRPGHYLGFCRMETFEKKCLFCEATNTGKSSLCSEVIYRHAVNALDVDPFRPVVYRLMVPLSVFFGLANYSLDYKYSDAFELTTGRVFVVSSRGRGIGTKYTIKVTDQVYPAGDEILRQVIDPTLEMTDRGLDYQRMILCELEKENEKG